MKTTKEMVKQIKEWRSSIDQFNTWLYANGKITQSEFDRRVLRDEESMQNLLDMVAFVIEAQELQKLQSY